MSSIIEGNNYDIFISYRQKDNKGDRSVSEFVEALKTELESAFKEEISVCFYINQISETFILQLNKFGLKSKTFFLCHSAKYINPNYLKPNHSGTSSCEEHTIFGI
jgi:hypothetical protein